MAARRQRGPEKSAARGGRRRGDGMSRAVRSSPRSPQHPQPVAIAQLLDQRLAEAALAHDLDQDLQSGGVADFARNLGAVEIGTEADAVFAEMFDEVRGVVDDQRGGRVLVVAAVGAQKARWRS